MGQLAFLKMFLLVSIPTDVNDNRRHVHVFKKGTRHMRSIAKILIEQYDSSVPNSQEELMKLPGVGRKTSNVVRGELYNEPVIAVDTHVERVSKRLYLASLKDNPLQVELKLLKLIEGTRRVLFHHQMIHFGRYHCISQRPKCDECKLKDVCRHYSKR